MNNIDIILKLKLWLNKRYELWKVARMCNRELVVSLWRIKQKRVIELTVPKKYKGSLEEIKKFEQDSLNYYKNYKVWNKDFSKKITIYEKTKCEDNIDLDCTPFEWIIKSKRIRRLMK